MCLLRHPLPYHWVLRMSVTDMKLWQLRPAVYVQLRPFSQGTYCRTMIALIRRRHAYSSGTEDLMQTKFINSHWLIKFSRVSWPHRTAPHPAHRPPPRLDSWASAPLVDAFSPLSHRSAVSTCKVTEHTSAGRTERCYSNPEQPLVCVAIRCFPAPHDTHNLSNDSLNLI